MKRMNLSLAMMWMVACGGAEEELTPAKVGSASVCLGVSAGAYPAEGDEQFFEVNGTLSTNLVGFTDFDLWSCPDDASHLVAIEDDNQRKWFVGWRMQDAQGSDIADALPVADGTAVSMNFRALRGGGAGFVISDDLGILAVVESTPGEQVLGAADYPGMRLELGDHVDTAKDNCGYQFSYDLRLIADADELTLGPMEEGKLQAGRSALVAQSLSTYQYDLDQTSCADAWGDLTWAAVRSP